MRCRVTMLLAMALVLPFACVSTGQSQELQSTKAAFNPDVVTVWHKLGIPQGVGRFKKFRDSRVNRDGLKPGKERKPPLLRLADPKNLEEGAPELLKVAAKMKMDADLAPQKIKAIRYICSVGCSCYNKQTAGLVEKALIEGMNDCTVSVRMAAIQAVLANAGNQCSAQGKCGTCCTKGIQKALQTIAYKMDDEGCYIEANAQVRSLAERALQACPPVYEKPKPAPKKDDPPIVDPKDPDLLDKGEKKKIPSEDLTDPGEDRKEKLELEGAGDGQKRMTTPREDNEARRGQGRIYQASSRTTRGSAWSEPVFKALQVRGVINDVQKNKSLVTVEFLKPFNFPVGLQMVIGVDKNNVSYGEVVASS